MLVLSRKQNEGIVIGGKDSGIRVIVIGIDKGKVRLGIEAPKGCTIFREELLVEIEGANRLSAFRGLDKMNDFIGGEDK